MSLTYKHLCHSYSLELIAQSFWGLIAASFVALEMDFSTFACTFCLSVQGNLVPLHERMYDDNGINQHVLTDNWNRAI